MQKKYELTNETIVKFKKTPYIIMQPISSISFTLCAIDKTFTLSCSFSVSYHP